jgi:hypothetical protein
MPALLANKFWGPFKQQVIGPDLRTYGFTSNLKGFVHQSTFTSQVNGIVGGVPLLEDFFWTLLTGFDVIHVGEAVEDGSYSKGVYRLAHRRPFLGWTPTTNPLEGEVTIDVPYCLYGEGCFHGGELSHLTLRSPLVAELQKIREVPAVTLELLQNAEALKMLVALRRAGVKPALITDRMLRSVSKKQDTWSNALGLQ